MRLVSADRDVGLISAATFATAYESEAMGLFDKLTGTKRPVSGVAPRSTEGVHAALLGLNGPEVPYVVRDGAPEGADLMAEWRMMEPAWQTFFARTQLSRAVQIRMRLVPEQHEVRVIEEQWEVTWVGDNPRNRGVTRIRPGANEDGLSALDDRTGNRWPS